MWGELTGKRIGINPFISQNNCLILSINLMEDEWHFQCICALQWRHNGRDGVSNHQPHECSFNRLFRRRSKKTSKLRVTDLCAGNSPVTGEFPAQRASNAENISIWWRHHVRSIYPMEGEWQFQCIYGKRTLSTLTLVGHRLAQCWLQYESWSFKISLSFNDFSVRGSNHITRNGLSDLAPSLGAGSVRSKSFHSLRL